MGRMMKRRRGNLPAGILFLVGFLTGILIPNLIWKYQWQKGVLSAMYLLENFRYGDAAGSDYLFEIIRNRGTGFFLAILCSYTIFGVPLAILEVLRMGIRLGLLLTVSILQFGLKGGMAGAALLVPQYLIYLPVVLLAMSAVYENSWQIWTRQEYQSEKLWLHSARCMAYSGFYAIGIFLEYWINPWIVEKIFYHI